MSPTALSTQLRSRPQVRQRQARRRQGKQSWIITGVLALLAVAAAGLTAAIEMSRRTPEIQEFGKVGQEFFPNFVDPTKATSLSVIAPSADNLKLSLFKVMQLPNGRWVIPSHYNYQVDARERLGRTASGVVGLEREAMVSRWKSDHARFGVVAPNPNSDESISEGTGRRLTVADRDNKVLVDLIVGKSVEEEGATGAGKANRYYVRRADEDEVYIAQLNIDLSTRFSDWINSNLLDLKAEDQIVGVTLNDYEVNEEARVVTRAEISKFQFSNERQVWSLEGLDDPTAQVSQAQLMKIVNVLSDLKVIGVRPKLPGLRPDLSIDPRYVNSNQDLERLAKDLVLRGILLVPLRNGQGVGLVAREGELEVGLASGIKYTLYFGRAFTGETNDIEIGTEAQTQESADANAPATDEQAAADAQSGEGDASAEESATDAASEASRPGRYVFILAQFDPSLLGPAPEAPVEPTRPPELDDPTLIPEMSEPTEEGGQGLSRVERLQEIALAFDTASRDYALAKQRYDRYQKQVEEGTKALDLINQRFGAWYYVIDGEDFSSLSLNREALLEPKSGGDLGGVMGDLGSQGDASEGEAGGSSPETLPPGFPGEEEPSPFPSLPPRLPEPRGSATTPPPSIPAAGIGGESGDNP